MYEENNLKHNQRETSAYSKLTKKKKTNKYYISTKLRIDIT